MKAAVVINKGAGIGFSGGQEEIIENLKVLLDIYHIDADVFIPDGNEIEHIRRISFPLKRYKEYISGDLNPLYNDGEIVICCVNTARSLAWKEGRRSLEQIADMRK